MSRCFPYPPPGYLRQGLVESIKLEREKVLPKAEQKIHKKREKREKKKERKEKDKTQGLNKRSKKLDDGVNGYKDEQLEISDLTEEHEPAVCYISDGSQSSSKRKRETLSSGECRVDGNIIKIRFALKKPRQPDAFLSAQGQAICSTSGRADSSTQPEAQKQCCTGSNKANAITAALPEQKVRCDDERREQIFSSSKTSSNDNEMQKAALQYKTFIEDWMPLPFQVKQSDDDDDDDDDWLFRTMQQGKPAARRSKVDNDVTCRASATSCPRAYFLPGADIYALPYAVPF